MSCPTILVFDSGVGGLSIANTIRALLPTVPLHYLADNAAFPYGTKTETELLARVMKVMQVAIQRYQPTLIVVACNTASTLVLPALREAFNLPFVGVVPAIKPAAKQSETKTIGLLATRATIQRTYTDELIKEFANDCEVIKVGCSVLVELAEAKLRGKNPSLTVLNERLKALQAPRIDTVVLACTHFPLLLPELQTVLPHIKYWVDSGKAIAERVKFLLQAQLEHFEPAKNSQNIAIFTAKHEDIDLLSPALVGYGFQQLHYLTSV